MSPTVQKPFVKFWLCLALAAITIAAFVGVSHCSFISLDDRVYVAANPPVEHGLSWSSVKWAFQTLHAGYWIPVTWLSHMLDCQLYGLNPGGHHVTNLIVHLANTVLLFLLLQRLTTRLWPSAFVALLFGIHPMHVESVAWIAERKDVLSAFFFMLTLLAYARYAEPKESRDGEGGKSLNRKERRGHKEGSSRFLTREGREFARIGIRFVPVPSRWLFYALALLFFALGLMSKPMLVTLPFVLLLLDFWPLGRFNAIQQNRDREGAISPPEGRRLATPSPAKKTGTPSSHPGPLRSHPMGRVLPNISARKLSGLVIEKIPFFLLTALFSFITFLAQRSAGAVKPIAEFSLVERFGHVPVSYAWYLLKFFWPTNLSVLYLFHKGAISNLEIVSAVLLLLAVTAFVLCRARANPYLIIGWLWFLGTLVPVIGFVQSGDQAYADRFAYLPYIGLSIMIAWGVTDLAGALRPKRAATVREGFSGASSSSSPVLLGAGALLIAIACFARTVHEVGYWKNGITLLNRAIALDPDNGMAWAALGSEYEIRGRYDKALDCVRKSIKINGHFDLAWEYLGYLLARQKDYANAEKAYQTALKFAWFKGDRVDACNRLGDTFALDSKYAQAASAYKDSLALDPEQAGAQTSLGHAYLRINESGRALSAFQAAVALQPDNPEALVGLGMVAEARGFDSEAVADYRKALQADPDAVIALNNLAWLLATDPDSALRNGAEAVSLAGRACRLTHYEKAFLIGTLAAAYAQAGRFDEAVVTAQKAHDVALANGEKDLAGRNEELLRLYKSHQAYRVETAKTQP